MDWTNPPGGRPIGLLALCGASLFLNVALIGVLATKSGGGEAVTAEQAPEPVADAAVVAAAAHDHDHLAEPAAEVAPAPVEPVATALPGGMQVATMVVEHSLSHTFQKGVDDKAAATSAVYSRLFAWDLDLRRDLQKGDRVTLAWRPGANGIPEVPAAKFKSLKHSTEYTAYQFKASGDAYASFWTYEGKESARRLKDSPIDNYEQITALLKDRPSHRGMDFKAPVGTPITSPRSGTVVRTNWNTRYNGGCVEVRYSDGVTARFLHLSEVKVKAGQKVGKGATIALSGNSGRSTAPHLHYEMDRNGKILDPTDYHGVYQRELPASDKARFVSVRDEFEGYLASAK